MHSCQVLSMFCFVLCIAEQLLRWWDPKDFTIRYCSICAGCCPSGNQRIRRHCREWKLWPKTKLIYDQYNHSIPKSRFILYPCVIWHVVKAHILRVIVKILELWLLRRNWFYSLIGRKRYRVLLWMKRVDDGWDQSQGRGRQDLMKICICCHIKHGQWTDIYEKVYDIPLSSCYTLMSS